MGVEIREARPEEHEEAGRITRMAYEEYVTPGEEGDWEDYLREVGEVAGRADRTTVLVAVEDGRILGTATLELHRRVDEGQPYHTAEPLPPHEAHIRMVGVHPQARRRGIARALMETCLDRARAAGKTLVTLYTSRRMKAAHAMYESIGFRRGEDWVLPDGFVLHYYELPLGT